MEEIFKVYKITRKATWEVSNFGRVKRNGILYECKLNNSRYLMFSGHYYVHRAVAQSFIPNPDNKPCVDHIDGNKLNNHVNNLRWVTYSENNLNEITRKHRSESMKGKIHSLETRKKMSESAKGKHSGEKSPMYGKKSTFFGKNHSEESKQKQSNAKKGRHIVLCEDGKRHWR